MISLLVFVVTGVNVPVLFAILFAFLYNKTFFEVDWIVSDEYYVRVDLFI